MFHPVFYSVFYSRASARSGAAIVLQRSIDRSQEFGVQDVLVFHQEVSENLAGFVGFIESLQAEGETEKSTGALASPVFIGLGGLEVACGGLGVVLAHGVNFTKPVMGKHKMRTLWIELDIAFKGFESLVELATLEPSKGLGV